jgi:hypothetical protein
MAPTKRDGCVANLGLKPKDGLAGARQSAGIVRLLFAHHMDHFDPTQDHTRAGNGLEAEHRPDSSFDASVVLLNAIIEVTALSNSNWYQSVP